MGEGLEDRNSGLGKEILSSLPCNPHVGRQGTQKLCLYGFLEGRTSLERGEKGRGEHRRTFWLESLGYSERMLVP